ncbi:MAG: hypothetical protein ACRC1M_04580 [Methanobacteriaceae archaeon]
MLFNNEIIGDIRSFLINHSHWIVLILIITLIVGILSSKIDLYNSGSYAMATATMLAMIVSIHESQKIFKTQNKINRDNIILQINYGYFRKGFFEIKQEIKNILKMYDLLLSWEKTASIEKKKFIIKADDFLRYQFYFLTMGEYYKETVPRKLYMPKTEKMGDIDVDIINVLEYYKKCDSYENYEKTYFKLFKKCPLDDFYFEKLIQIINANAKNVPHLFFDYGWIPLDIKENLQYIKEYIENSKIEDIILEKQKE